MKRAQNIVSKLASGDGRMESALQLGLTIILFIALLGLVSTPALANGNGRHQNHPRACSKTASAAFLACQNEKKDDYWIGQGNCYNDTEGQAECFADAKDEYKEAKAECGDQLEARKDLCDELGEAPYDPEIDPEDFVTAFTESNKNPYFPLVPGTIWRYLTFDKDGNLLERDTVEVTEETKAIEYPSDSGKIFTCAVVHDVVEEYDEDTGEFTITEDTLDWYAQKINGDVWYFGESSQTLEDGELVDIEGSWKAGVDFAKPGIIMYVDLSEEDIGKVYRQEFALGDAEDWARLEIVNAATPVIVPYAAANCVEGSSHCRQTVEGTPLEPDVVEYKYYKQDYGTVLEYNPDTGEQTALVDFITP